MSTTGGVLLGGDSSLCLMRAFYATLKRGAFFLIEASLDSVPTTVAVPYFNPPSLLCASVAMPSFVANFNIPLGLW